MTPVEQMQEPPEEAQEQYIPDDEKYWAARSPEALVQVIRGKERRFFEFAQRRGYTAMWSTAMAEHFGMTGAAFPFSGFDAQGVGFEGDEGELIRFRVAEMRSFVRQSVTMTTKDRPRFQAEALNSDSASMGQVDAVDVLASAMYEHDMGEKRERIVVERGDLFAKMWAWGRWDADGGAVVLQPAGMLPDGTPSPEMVPTRTGANKFRLLHPWDVITEPTRDLDDDDDWVIVRERRSRWELMEEMHADPELREYLRNVSVRDECAYEAMFGFDSVSVSEDDVICKWFYHSPTMDIPQGRCAIVVGDRVLKDGPWLGFDMMGAPQLPVVDYMPATMVGSTLGYSDAWDMIVLQQMLTQLTSDAATNLATFGRQTIFGSEGADWNPQQLANGMSYVEMPKGAQPPQALTMADLPPATQWFIGFLLQRFQSLSGQNSVRRGTPDQNIKSGTMAALFDTIALEYVHDKQAALDDFRARVCSLGVALMRQNATVPQIVSVVGEGERSRAEQFTKEKFTGLHRVRVRPTTAAMKSRANQLELLNILKDVPGAIENPMQLVNAFNTGQWKPVYRAAQAKLDRIAWENEQFLRGTPVDEGQPRIDPMTGQLKSPEASTPEVPVFIEDDPFVHVPEHVALKSDPSVMRDPKRIRAIDVHIEAHMRTWLNIPPPLAQILRIQPPMMPGPPPGAEPPGKVGKSNGAENKPEDHAADGTKLPKPAQPPPQAATQPGA